MNANSNIPHGAVVVDPNTDVSTLPPEERKIFEIQKSLEKAIEANFPATNHTVLSALVTFLARHVATLPTAEDRELVFGLCDKLLRESTEANVLLREQAGEG